MTPSPWWGKCPECGFYIDNPAHVLGCAHNDTEPTPEDGSGTEREADRG